MKIYPRTLHNRKLFLVVTIGISGTALLVIALLSAVINNLAFVTTSTPIDDVQSIPTSVTNAFVTRSETKFQLNGKDFKFVGFNLFDAAATNDYKCAHWARFTDQELDAAFKYMKQQGGATVLRFWAFQTYTKGGTDFSGIDRVITIAKNNGFKVIPVLENGPSHCTGQTIAKWQYNNDTWYTNGYKVKFGSAALSYRDYVKVIVERYKNEPAIFGWMMMNEADTSKKNSTGKSVLIDFTKDIAALIKGIDSKHLLTVGTQSNGASGATGQDFIDVYGLSQIDFAEGHDWAYWGSDTDPLPGSSDGKIAPDPASANCLKTYQAKIGCSISQAIQILKKPYLMGEAGVPGTDANGRVRRADLLNKKMKAAFDNGVAGYLIWQFNKVVDTEGLDILSSTNDPIFPAMKAFSMALPALTTETPSPTPIPTSPPPAVTPTPTMQNPTPQPPPMPTPNPSPNPSPTPKPVPAGLNPPPVAMTPPPSNNITPPTVPPTNGSIRPTNQPVSAVTSIPASSPGVTPMPNPIPAPVLPPPQQVPTTTTSNNSVALAIAAFVTFSVIALGMFLMFKRP